jgi:hypothetical protein
LSSNNLLAFFLSATSEAVSISPPLLLGELSILFAPEPALARPLLEDAFELMDGAGDLSRPIREDKEAMCVAIEDAARS